MQDSPRTLYLEAHERLAVMDVDGMLEQLERAIAKDPDYFPAHLAYVRWTGGAGRTGRRTRFYEALGGSASLRECTRALARHRSSDNGLTARRLERIRSERSRGCIAGAAATFGPAIESDSAKRIQATRLQQFANRYPESSELRATYASALLAIGEESRADTVMNFAGGESFPSWGRVELMVEQARRLRARGDMIEAKRLIGEIQRLDRDPGLGIRWLASSAVYDLALDARLLREPVPGALQVASIARVAPNGRGEMFAFMTFERAGRNLYNAGDYRSARILLDSAGAIADRNGSPEFILASRLYRGRVLRALGRPGDAVADLQHAVRAGRDMDEQYLTADAFHQLSHAYETLADWPRAAAAVDSFVARGDALHDPGLLMTRFYDAGVIRWKAGWHAAADQSFRQMVITIDSLDKHHSYAGKYFEQKGDLSRALDYYRRAIGEDAAETKLGLAGIARVYELTGRLDSAVAVAGRHDALPENSPDLLLPRLLARTGRPREAVATARSWARTQLERGNAAAAARTLNDLAEMRPHIPSKEALSLAHASAKYALRVTATRELIAARRIAATITAELGSTVAAARELRSVLDVLRAHPDPLEELRTMTALARAYSLGGDRPAALVWFDSAAARVNALETQAGDDLLAARFRSARVDMFDGAFDAALDSPPHHRVSTLIEWSERKKNIALASGLHSPQPTRLPDDIAIADFINVRDTLWAIVATADEQRLVRLPMTASTAARLSRDLLQPLRTVAAGQVDLARAQFDLDLARRLYDGLLRPIESLAPHAVQLVLVPDAPLHSVPFDALVRASPRTATDYLTTAYAADRWNIVFAATYSGARHATSLRTGIRGPMLLVTANATAVERENAAIRRVWRDVSLATGPATTEAVARTMGRYAILHFATHAVSDDSDPLASHLRLQPGSGADGLLHANEIPPLPTGPLVVLSACETASGEILHGAGALSLARAFLARGAAATVATRWPVGESAAQLSETFYAELARGTPPAMALYSAKRRVRSDPRTAHPFFWASHVLLTR